MSELILKNTQGTLEMIFSAGDVTSGNVAVTVTGADGSTVSSGNAAHQGSGGSGDYTYTLPPQSELNSLTVTWSGTWGVAQSLQSFAEIVGQNLFTLADLRAFGDRGVSNTTTYPDTMLRDARNRITDFFEQICGTSFIPRYQREVLDGSGLNYIFLSKKRPRRIISCTVDGTAIDLTKVSAYSSGRLDWGWNGYWNPGWQNVVVAYEYGYPNVPPPISRAALVLARYDLVSNDLSDRMVSFDNDLGSVRLSVPGMNYPTGIPVVDATLAQYQETELFGLTMGRPG